MPVFHDFGYVEFMNVRRHTVTYRNRSDSTITAVTAAPSGDAFVLAGGGGIVSIAPGDSHKVMIRFAPRQEIEFRDSMKVELADSGRVNVIVIMVVFAGTGIRPAAVVADASRARGVSLTRASPNPVTSSARFELDVATSDRVLLDVFDVRGTRVARLVDAHLPTGPHTITWSPAGLPSGSYVYRLTAGRSVTSGQLMYAGE